MSQRGLFATLGTLYRLGVLPIASIAWMSSASSWCSWKFSSMRDLVTLCVCQLSLASAQPADLRDDRDALACDRPRKRDLRGRDVALLGDLEQ